MDERKKLRLVEEAERTLTNFFNKTKNEKTMKNDFITAAGDSLNFIIQNNSDALVDVALACGGIPTDGIYVDKTDSESPVLRPHKHDLTMLELRGFDEIAAVLDDYCKKELEDNANGVQIKNPSKRISIRQQLLSFINNPRYVREIIVNTNNIEVFNSGNFLLGSGDPFAQSRLQTTVLTQYMNIDQQLKTKIQIAYPFGEANGLQWNEDLLFIMQGIPGKIEVDGSSVATFVSFNINFYNE